MRKDLLARAFFGVMIVALGGILLLQNLDIIKIKTKALLNSAIELPADTAEYIARTVKTNIRELEGVLNQVMAYAEMRNVIPTVDFATEVLVSARPSQTRHITQ